MKRYILLFLLLAQNTFAAQGCMIIAHLNTGEIVKQQGKCDQRVTPASTFKIPLSVMGFDSGILKTATVPEWSYEKEQPQTPTSWLKNSTVWYSQKLTTQLGMDRFRGYVQNFQYGNQNLIGDEGKNNGLTHAWLDSSLTISPEEQMVFLTKLLKNELPASKHSQETTRNIMPSETLVTGWKMSGKTGTGSQDGWFVGWATKGEDVLVFVSLSKNSSGPNTREAFKKELIAMTEALP